MRNPGPRPDTKSSVTQLAVMGKMAAGKTFGSSYLVEKYGGTLWTPAERIKQIAHALVHQNGDLGLLLTLVISDDELRQDATVALLKYANAYDPEPGAKPRKLYQDVGQILRDLHPSTQYCWEEDLERRIQAAPSPLTIVDMRAKESFEFFVRQRGYTSLLIDAPLEVRQRRMLQRDNAMITDPALLTHQSETDVDQLDFDIVVQNAEDDPAPFYAALDAVVAGHPRADGSTDQTSDTDELS